MDILLILYEYSSDFCITSSFYRLPLRQRDAVITSVRPLGHCLVTIWIVSSQTLYFECIISLLDEHFPLNVGAMDFCTVSLSHYQNISFWYRYTIRQFPGTVPNASPVVGQHPWAEQGVVWPPGGEPAGRSGRLGEPLSNPPPVTQDKDKQIEVVIFKVYLWQI